jgi:hypothetical protein
MAVTFKAYVDWNNDGDFADTGEDVTQRVLDGRTPLAIRYGRDQARALSPISGGTANFELNNISRDYSPDNASSPLNGSVLPGRPVLIQGTLAATTYTVFYGQLDDFTVKPDINDRSIDVSCIDALGRLKGQLVSTGVLQGVRTGDAVNALLDAAGVASTARDVDTGASLLPYWWLDNEDAFDALLALVTSEGAPALVTVDTAGRIVFRSRHHRLLRTASTTVQSTWRSSGGTEPLISSPAAYNHGWKEIVNSVTFQMPMRQTSPPGVVWSTTGTISLTAGEARDLAVTGTSPFINAITPTDGNDFTTLSGLVTVTLSNTSGASITMRLTADPGGPATITGLQLRAWAVTTLATQVVTVTDPASVAKYGIRSLTEDLTPTWATVYDAQAIGEIIIGRRGDRVPTVSVTMVGANATRQTQQLTRNLSDRVHVTETHSGLDSDCFIEQIAPTIGQGGLAFSTTFGLEKVSGTVANPLTFDVVGKGFDQGFFIPIGYDDGATIALFDGSGVGFDQGVFAH